MKRTPCFARLFLAFSLISLLLWGCSNNAGDTLQGYVEGEFVYVASKIAGRLDELHVSRGDRVKPGDKLFTLEREFEIQGVKRAEAQLEMAKYQLADKQKGLRPEELAQIDAQLKANIAMADYNKLEFNRRRKLFSDSVIAEEEYNRVSTDLDKELQAVREARAKLATGKLPDRIDRVKSAEAAVFQADADLKQAVWNLDQKTQSALQGALVFDVVRYKGEWVNAGAPVVVLLPPENVKIRFFVPEAMVSTLRIGQEVDFTFDGAKSAQKARINYVSPKAEYNPPVIYSQNFREKLVYLVEAKVSRELGETLNPGRPIDVTIKRTEPK